MLSDLHRIGVKTIVTAEAELPAKTVKAELDLLIQARAA